MAIPKEPTSKGGDAHTEGRLPVRSPLADPAEALRTASLNLRRWVDCDVTALVLSDATSQETRVLIQRDPQGEKPEVRTIARPLSKRLQLLDGQPVAISKGIEQGDALFVNQLLGDAARNLRSGLVIPLTFSQGLQGFLVVGSTRRSLWEEKHRLHRIQLEELFAPIAERDEAQHQEVFEYAGTPMACVGVDKLLLRVNAEFVRFSGYARQSIEGKMTWLEFLPPEDWKAFNRYFERCLLDVSPGPATYEGRFIGKDKVDRWVAVTMALPPRGDQFILSLQDLTAHRHFELELRERNERLAVINEITGAINSTLDFKKLFAIICVKLRRMLDYDAAFLVLYDEARTRFMLEALSLRGQGITWPRRLLEPAIAQKLCLHRRSIVAEEPKDEKLAGVVEEVLGESVGTAIIVPLKLKRRIIGCFGIGNKQRGAYASSHLEILEQVATQIASAVDKARLHQETQKSLRNLSLLSEVSNSLSSSLDLQTVLRQLVSATRKVMDAQICSIRFVEKDQLTPGVAAGYKNPEARNHPIRIQGRLLQSLIEDRTPLIIEDLLKDARLPESRAQRMSAEGVRSYLGVPVVSRGQTIGVLSIYTNDVRKFTDEDITLLSTIADYASIAIENARLYAETARTKNFLENMLESSVDAIITTDRLGQITYFGRGAQRILGYSPNEIVGKPIALLYEGGKREALHLTRMLLKNAVIENHRATLVAKNRGHIPMSLSLSLLRGQEGQVVGTLGIGKDISELVEALEGVQRKNAALEEFLYVVSHNLKAPLLSMEGFATLLQSEEQPSLTEKGQHYLERLRKNIKQMDDLIHDLLEVAKAEQISQALEPVNMATVVGQVLDEFGYSLLQKKIEVDMAENLPTITADPKGMYTVLSNLLSNAIKYIGETPSPRIEIGYTARERCHEFWVKDNGVGIDPQYHQKVFELFHRVQPESNVEGTGVGLTLVKKIVENHRGQVWLDSMPGRGTTVYFTIPKLIG